MYPDKTMRVEYRGMGAIGGIRGGGTGKGKAYEWWSEKSERKGQHDHIARRSATIVIARREL